MRYMQLKTFAILSTFGFTKYWFKGSWHTCSWNNAADFNIHTGFRHILPGCIDWWGTCIQGKWHSLKTQISLKMYNRETLCVTWTPDLLTTWKTCRTNYNLSAIHDANLEESTPILRLASLKHFNGYNDYSCFRGLEGQHLNHAWRRAQEFVNYTIVVKFIGRCATS